MSAVTRIGQQLECPLCGVQRSRDYDHSIAGGPKMARSCSGSWWFVRLFGGCNRLDPHLHQTCKTCGGSWACEIHIKAVEHKEIAEDIKKAFD